MVIPNFSCSFRAKNYSLGVVQRCAKSLKFETEPWAGFDLTINSLKSGIRICRIWTIFYMESKGRSFKSGIQIRGIWTIFDLGSEFNLWRFDFNSIFVELERNRWFENGVFILVNGVCHEICIWLFDKYSIIRYSFISCQYNPKCNSLSKWKSNILLLFK